MPVNRLQGTITDIKSEGSLSIVKVQCEGIVFSSIVIDTPESKSYLRVNEPINLVFKETEVIIGKGDVSKISLRNKLHGKVEEIERNNLLAKLTIKTNVGIIYSVITSNAVNNLQIVPGDEVWAMIKTNEVMLSK